MQRQREGYPLPEPELEQKQKISGIDAKSEERKPAAILVQGEGHIESLI